MVHRRPQKEGRQKVIPATVHADLNQVAAELASFRRQTVEFFRGVDATSSGRQPRSKHVSNMAQLAQLADRARSWSCSRKLFRYPNEFRLSVAQLRAIHASVPKRAQNAPPIKAVVDGAWHRAGAATFDGLEEGHGCQGY
jgi:hypothetical protein